MNEYQRVNWENGTVVSEAYVTIDNTDYEVTPRQESGSTPVNATNLNIMDAGIYNLSQNAIDKSVLKLLTVSATAPSSCAEGDMYYNTTSQLIYTATATDTWGETGETPSTKYMYVDLTNSTMYYYDGTNFTSYSGSGSGIIVDSTVSISSTNTVQNQAITNYVNEQIGLIYSSMCNIIYPIGSIYMSVYSTTSPATLFGGTWVQLKDRFLLGAGDTYSNGATGGSATVTLTTDQIPSHNHTLNTNRQYETGANTDSTKIGRTMANADGATSNIATNYTGGGQAHNNMPPYLVVYMWKRTA